MISFEVPISKPKTEKIHITSRNLKKIDIELFKTSLKSSLNESVVNSVTAFNDCLTRTLDTFAPLRKRVISIRPFSPWINDAVKTIKQKKRQAERKWKKSGLTIHKEIFKSQKTECIKVIKNEKRKYVNDKISSTNSSKDLFKICNVMLGKSNDKSLPDFAKKNELPDIFNNFFIEKIQQIRDQLDLINTQPSFKEYKGPIFNCFTPVSEEFVKKIILDSPKSVCDLDPLPPQLFIASIDLILPHVTQIINTSLMSGIVPDDFKEALVDPLLKKLNLDINVLKNYRPVSNLLFISKVLERVVFSQIGGHLSENNLNEKFQSAYKARHSTETCLLKVTSDILNSIDDGHVSVLTMLDLSSAFDTIDHEILLKRLKITLVLMVLLLNGSNLTSPTEFKELKSRVTYLLPET